MSARPSVQDQVASVSIVLFATVIPWWSKSSVTRRGPDPGRFQSHTPAVIRHEPFFISAGPDRAITSMKLGLLRGIPAARTVSCRAALGHGQQPAGRTRAHDRKLM